MNHRAIALLASVASVQLAGCSAEKLPPIAEARLVVDTDLPTSLQLRLRVDVFDGDGRWIDARDVARPSASDWPASFSVFSPDDAAAREVRVRLRIYPGGETRDYRGERLVVGGRDVTPDLEPAPGVTIDRLLHLRLRAGVRGRLPVVLRGACAGTMSDVAGDVTCIDDAALLVPVETSVLEEGALDVLARTETGRFGLVDAPSGKARGPSMDGDQPRFDAQVAVAGGVFVLGGRQISNEGMTAGVVLGATPTRLVVVSSLLVDQHELTVARFRSMLARGFVPPAMPDENRAPGDFTDCSWSRAVLPGAARRESYPLSCVPYATALAACRFDGGDLPTEAEWEYAATSWGRVTKTPFPWGTDGPSCERMTYGRFQRGGAGDDSCVQRGFRAGARPVDDAPGDLTSNVEGPKIVGLAGNLAEWTSDAYAPYTARCWAAAPQRDPRCADDSDLRTVRGGAYATNPADLLSVFRHPLSTSSGGFRDVGFRCVERR